MTGSIVALIFGLFIILQIIFAIMIKIELFKLRRKDQITEEDAINFHGKLKLILWVPYTGKYFSQMRECYGYIHQSPLVSFETKKKVHRSMRFRLVQGITVPKKYDSAS